MHVLQDRECLIGEMRYGAALDTMREATPRFMITARSPIAGPVVLYELNEVSWRVVDWYVRQRPHSNLAALLPVAETFTSVTRDEGELHPWVTWPSLHRSVYNTVHGVSYINQDLSWARDYPPVWERAAAAGKKVGVFGSLQSYPPPTALPYVFYVPDTFAPGPETIPSAYACFQRLNLRQTQSDRAVAQPIAVDGSVAGDLMGLVRNGLTLKTAARLATQLLMEKRSFIHRTRRPILQVPIAFDVFCHALAHSTPDFCTFFTNHVAGIMHRYWKYAFPEDFDYELRGDADRFYRESLIVAMNYADEQIAFLRDYVDARRGRLYIASSMGQEAIRQIDEIEVSIENLERLLAAIGYSRRYKPLMAMHPQYSFEFESDADMHELGTRLDTLRRADGKPVFHGMECAGRTASWSIASGSGYLSPGEETLYVTDLRTGARKTLPELGLKAIQRDAGTGYHQPEGILVRYGSGIEPNADRRRIESVEISPMILADLGVGGAAPVEGLAPAAADAVTA